MYLLIEVQVDLHLGLTKVIRKVVSEHPFYQVWGKALCKRGNAVHRRPLV